MGPQPHRRVLPTVALTEGKADQLVRRFFAGERIEDLASRFQVSCRQVEHIIRTKAAPRARGN